MDTEGPFYIHDLFCSHNLPQVLDMLTVVIFRASRVCISNTLYHMRSHLSHNTFSAMINIRFLTIFREIREFRKHI